MLRDLSLISFLVQGYSVAIAKARVRVVFEYAYWFVS